jgi:hypothetical protein
MPMCPNGHQSGTDDWCEICGMRMAAPASTHGSRPPSSASSSSTSPSSAPPSSPSPPPGSGPGGYGPAAGRPADPAAVAEVCPQCGTPREGAALFCEECRYNFRTHSPTVAPGPPPGTAGTPGGPPPAPTAPGFPPYQRYESQRSRPSQINRPAEPVPSESVTVTSGSGDFLLDPPSRPVPGQPGAASQASTAAPAGSASASSSPGTSPPASPAGPSGPPVASGSAAGPAADPLSGAGTATSVLGGPDAAGLSGPVSRTAWVAVIAADREYFTAMMSRSGPEAEGLYFPAFSPEVRLPLTGNQITVGRRRHSTGEAPDIDLARAPEDPGVSHQHAVLVQQPDGSWAVVDQDSTNGTTVNLGEDPIRPYTPVPLDEGDRVHVGAWTTITLRRA